MNGDRLMIMFNHNFIFFIGNLSAHHIFQLIAKNSILFLDLTEIKRFFLKYFHDLAADILVIENAKKYIAYCEMFQFWRTKPDFVIGLYLFEDDADVIVDVEQRCSYLRYLLNFGIEWSLDKFWHGFRSLNLGCFW